MLRPAITTDDDDDFEIINGKRVLKDQRRLRVSLFDAQRLREDPWRSPIHDGRSGQPNMVGHRPGFLLGDSNRRAREQAYQDYENWATNRWRDQDDPPNGSVVGQAPLGAYPYSAAKEGSSCTIDGRPGVLVRATENSNWLVCKPIKQNLSGSSDPERAQSDAANAKEAAYRAYDTALANAWRGNK
jgi:hypothetical protein